LGGSAADRCGLAGRDQSDAVAHVPVLNALGGIAWAITVGMLAYFLGAAVDRLFRVAGLIAVAATLLIAAAYLLWNRQRRAAWPSATTARG
jgi:hypothetical protein